MCYASKPNSFLIRPNGQIRKCTVALDDPINNVGYLNPDGTLEIDNDVLRQWFIGLETLDLETLKCPYFFALKPKNEENQTLSLQIKQ
jgi:uncharacterized protein